MFGSSIPIVAWLLTGRGVVPAYTAKAVLNPLALTDVSDREIFVVPVRGCDEGWNLTFCRPRRLIHVPGVVARVTFVWKPENRVNPYECLDRFEPGK